MPSYRPKALSRQIQNLQRIVPEHKQSDIGIYTVI